MSVRRLDRCTRTCFPHSYHCTTKVLISLVLVCMSADWTGALVILLRFYRCTTKVSILPVLVCLSADWAGALVLLNSSLSAFDLLLASFLRGCLVGLLSLGYSFFVVFFRVVCWGLCLSACFVIRPALFVLVCRVLFGLCAFLLVSCGVAGLCWPLAGVVFSFLCCFVRFCLCFLGLLRVGSFSPGCVPPCPAHPLGWSFGAFWSSQCSAGPSLRVSGCILRRPGCHACGMECSDG